MSLATDSREEVAKEKPQNFLLELLRENRWSMIVLLAQLPMVFLHLRNLWSRPQYQYFPIVLVAFTYLLWTRIERLPIGVRGPERRLLVNLLFAISFLMLVFCCVVVFSPWLATVAFVITARGVLFLLRERYFITNGLGIWILLLLLIPLPSAYDVRLSHSFQDSTALASSQLLKQLGVFNVIEGSKLSLEHGPLVVNNVCCGVLSITSMFACSLIVAVCCNRPFVHATLLVIGSLIWAFAINVLQILITAISQERYAIDLTSGRIRDVVELGLIALAIILLLSADRLLAWFFAPLVNDRFRSRVQTSMMTQIWDWVSKAGRPRKLRRMRDHVNIDPRRRKRRPEYIVATWAFLFCFAGLTSAAMVMRATVQRDLGPPGFAAGLDESSMPESVEGWTRVSFSEEHDERLFPQSSKLWHYRHGDLSAAFSIDSSFPDWRDLSISYQSLGWQRDHDHLIVDPRTPGGCYITSDLRRDDERGHLIYSFITEDARAYPAPEKVQSVAEIFLRRYHQSSQALYQVQLWVTANRQLHQMDKDKARTLYEHLRREVLRLVMQQDKADLTPRGESQYELLE